MENSTQKKHLHQCNEIELAIFNIIHVVGTTAEDPLLSEAILKLSEARSLVNDFALNKFRPKPGPVELILDQKTELDVLTVHLENLLASPEIKNIEDSQILIMYIQLNSMRIYSRCLHQRLVSMQR